MTETEGTGGPCPFALSERPMPGESFEALLQRLAAALAARRGQLLGLLVFGSIADRQPIEAALELALGPCDWPVTWIEGASCEGGMLAGVQAFAVSGAAVKRIRLGQRVAASVYEDADARHCVLGGIVPQAHGMRPAAQAQQALGTLEAALELAGFGLGEVVRTWFYNRDILAWYGDFNRVRSGHYAGVTFKTGSLPASTGIGAANIDGAALAIAAWAIQSWDGRPLAREIASPLQCPAPAYGSSFSRAMELVSGGTRRLFVSGTASIHPDGKTAWVGDLRKQVDLTMEVVGAILQSRGLGFGDVTRAIAYFKRPEYVAEFEAWLAAHGLEAMPAIRVHADVCRDDLLFEIELDA